MIRLQMKKYNMILTTKISALSLGKIDKFEGFTCEEILPSHQSRIKKQAKFIFSQFSKAFEKQIKKLKNILKSKLKFQKF